MALVDLLSNYLICTTTDCKQSWMFQGLQLRLVLTTDTVFSNYNLYIYLSPWKYRPHLDAVVLAALYWLSSKEQFNFECLTVLLCFLAALKRSSATARPVCFCIQWVPFSSLNSVMSSLTPLYLFCHTCLCMCAHAHRHTHRQVHAWIDTHKHRGTLTHRHKQTCTDK